MKGRRVNWDPTENAAAAWGEALTRTIVIASDRIASRSRVTFVNESAELTITIDFSDDAPTDGFRIDEIKSGVLLTAQSVSGLAAGIGKLLRGMNFDEDGISIGPWRGASSPDCRVRGIQMDSHFCNFYHMAPENELRTYVEDLALWGVNCIDVVFPLIDFLGWDDPEIRRVLRQIKTIYDTAKSLEISVGLEIVPNQDFINFKPEFKASPIIEAVARRGNNGNNMCPNKPGALPYIVSTYGKVIRYLKDHGVSMDFICFWPYDEGGCTCEHCRPWGANGFLKAAKAIAAEVRNDLPDVKIILSTWLFDTPDDEGEWTGLSEALRQDNGWVDYVLADSHTDFPQYPLTHPTPGNLPLLNYPEISMWALFPWGGYGANPLPERFQALWNQVKDRVQGGIAYSEGIFDDINKVLISQFYWNRETTAEETLSEYIRYEYAPFAVPEVWEAICKIESNHIRTAVGKDRNTSGESNTQSVDRSVLADAVSAFELLSKADDKLPERAKKSWRWRVLYLRGKLDVLRFRRSLERSGELKPGTTWTDVLKGSAEAAEAMEELTRIYHSNLEADDQLHPMFRCVRPALKEIR